MALVYAVRRPTFVGKRGGKVLLGAFAFALTLAAVDIGRWNRLARNGRRLVSEASGLPRRYEVGSGPPLSMVVLGDSTALGVGAGSLEATLPYRVAMGLRGRVSVTNLAVSGARLVELRDQVLKVPLGLDWALVSVSANDATHGTTLPAFKDALARLLDGLTERGVQRVVLSTTPNFRTTPALPWAVNRLFGRRSAGLTRAIRGVAGRYPFVRIADLNAEGTLSAGEYADDGFHPNAAGYAAWAAVFIRAIGSRR